MLRLLGPLELTDADDDPIPLGARERVLLAALVLAGPSPVSTERLIEELWPSRAPANSLNVLRNVVMRLRRGLGEQDELAVEGRPGGYLLRRSRDAIDLDVVTSLVAEAEAAHDDGDEARRVAVLERAIKLWRGAAFEGFDELTGVAGERARFEELEVAAREQWVDAMLEVDRTSDAVVALDALCTQYPFRELLWQQRVIALHRLGRDNDAIEVAREYRRMLRDELGLEPGPNWRALEEAVLSHDPKLRRTQAALPAGQVTFVRFEFDPPDDDPDAAWPAFVSEMGGILGGIVSAHGGGVAEHGGTRMTAAFAQPADALAAAAAGSRAGRARGTPFGHRTGVHTGDATPQGGRYIGLAAHQAERVAATAHPGQVLVSGATAQQLSLADRARLTDLGRFRIVGIAADTALYQLVDDDAPAFPTPRALAALTANLPPQVSEFVGREEELGEVGALLASSRIATVVGPAGVGKTRLAIELAAQVAAGDSACFVSLAPVTDPSLLGVAIGEALGVDVSKSTDPLGPIADTLAARPALLILDNCEHLADSAADFVAALAARCPVARVLATSREPLGIAAEAVWRLAPLSVPPPATSITAAEAIEHEAVRLLAIRLHEADATFAVDDAVASMVCDIVRALDGLPLAIELAAPIAAALGLDELHRGLDDRLDLLEMSRRRGDPRHHLLRTALEWSHSLLGDHERLLYRRLGIFAAPVDLATISLVCGDDALDERLIRRATAKLVSRSLVMRVDHDDATRFGLLETMKVHARELLVESADRVAVGRRHADWTAARAAAVRVDSTGTFTDLTSQLLDFASDLRAAVAFLTDEDPDAALQLLMTCRPMWDWMSRWSDITDSLDRALAGATDTPPDVRAGMYMIRGFAMMSRDLREARDALANAADLYAKAGDHGPQGLAVERLAGVACAQGDFALAEQIAEKARRLDLENGEDRLLAFLQQEHINLALARGENRMAAHLVDEILPTLRKSGQLVAALRMMTAKARALCRLGEVEEALDIALEVVRETHETPGAASFNTWVNYALSEIELARGNPSAAARCLADALADTLPNQQLRLASLLLHAGSAAAATDRLHEAVSLFGAGQTMRDRGGEAASRGADGERELRILELRERLGAQTFHQDWRRGAALVDAGSAVTFARNVLAAVRADVTQ